MRRWRLALGRRRRPGRDRRPAGPTGDGLASTPRWPRSTQGDRAEAAKGRRGERWARRSAPNVARWLGDIRGYFPSTVVQVMQADAIDRLDLDRLLLEPEMLDAVEPDVHLVGTLLSLNRVMPEKTKQTARTWSRKVVDELERRLGAADPRGGHRGAEPGRPDQPAPPPRHRLEPDHPGQPQALPARAAHHRARSD